jgi:hypothetical protein
VRSGASTPVAGRPRCFTRICTDVALMADKFCIMPRRPICLQPTPARKRRFGRNGSPRLLRRLRHAAEPHRHRRFGSSYVSRRGRKRLFSPAFSKERGNSVLRPSLLVRVLFQRTELSSRHAFSAIVSCESSWCRGRRLVGLRSKSRVKSTLHVRDFSARRCRRTISLVFLQRFDPVDNVTGVLRNVGWDS